LRLFWRGAEAWKRLDMKVSERELLELNPELRRSCTPPRSYQLKLPKGRAETFARNWPSLEPTSRLQFASHRAQRGDSLAAIAAAYGVTPAAVLKMNGLRPGRRLRVGTEVIIPLSGVARRRGIAPADSAEARARIEELKRQNPEWVEKEPPTKQVVPRVEVVDGRKRATIFVQAGDTLWAIAQKFGVGVAELCRWNGIKNPRRQKLQIGREIVVYPQGMQSPAGPG
jgi:membrane-bound lytic murein transglycosylase D